MKTKLFTVALAAIFAWGCNESKEEEKPIVFSIETTSLDFIDGMSSDRVVKITSGNGWYTVRVEDESVVKVEPADGDYDYGAFTFSPKAIGDSKVTITDIRAKDFKEISVSVKEPGIDIYRANPVITVEIEDETLAAEIQSLVAEDLVFEAGVSYRLSNKERRIMYVLDGSDKPGVRNFRHTIETGGTYLSVTADRDGDGIADYNRKLLFVSDNSNQEYSYVKFYGLSAATDSRTNFQESQIKYSEDLTQKYKEMEGYEGVTSVTVVYNCSYNFVGFEEIK